MIPDGIGGVLHFNNGAGAGFAVQRSVCRSFLRGVAGRGRGEV